MSRIAFAAIVLSASFALADLVHLKDGTSVEGTVKRTPSGWQITKPDGKVATVASDAVKSISFTGREVTRDGLGPDDKLASLRRSVEVLSDPRQIAERFKRFVEQNAGTPAAEDAKKDLAVWQERADKNMVKAGSEWVTPEQRLKLQVQTLAQVDEVRQLLKAGRVNEADAMLAPAQSVDPSNPSLLFLRGLIQFRQDQLLPARKTFEAANQQMPSHAPTLNNLAIVAVRQNQWPQALAYYDQALQASPLNRDVLDNVAEALYALPENQRKLPIAEKLIKRFGDQDLALAAKLHPQGLYRWGATWVDSKQLETLKQAEKEMKDKLDAMSAEFDETKKKAGDIERDIDQNDREMRRLAAYQYAYGPDNRPVRVRLPNEYYELERDNQRLKQDLDQQYAKLDELRTQARNLQKTYPIPKYTGNQKLIDVEGTPVALPVGPSTDPPATQPATRANWKV